MSPKRETSHHFHNLSLSSTPGQQAHVQRRICLYHARTFRLHNATCTWMYACVYMYCLERSFKHECGLDLSGSSELWLCLFCHVFGQHGVLWAIQRTTWLLGQGSPPEIVSTGKTGHSHQPATVSTVYTTLRIWATALSELISSAIQLHSGQSVSVGAMLLSYSTTLYHTLFINTLIT